MIVDATRKILFVNTNWPGSCHDSYVYANTIISRRFQNGMYHT